jgi:hypothetical protein
LASRRPALLRTFPNTARTDCACDKINEVQRITHLGCEQGVQTARLQLVYSCDLIRGGLGGRGLTGGIRTSWDGFAGSIGTVHHPNPRAFRGLHSSRPAEQISYAPGGDQRCLISVARLHGLHILRVSSSRPEANAQIRNRVHHGIRRDWAVSDLVGNKLGVMTTIKKMTTMALFLHSC